MFKNPWNTDGIYWEHIERELKKGAMFFASFDRGRIPAQNWHKVEKAILEKLNGINLLKEAAMFTIAVNRYKDFFDIDVGRGSKWGNPYSHEPKSRAKYIVSSREEAIELYSFWILGQIDLISNLGELKGKRLGCFCLPKSCHATILADLADKFDVSSDFSDYSAFW